MKNLYLTLALLLTISFAFALNSIDKISTHEAEEIATDCGGCIAYADSRDDGSDRTLTRWQNDLDTCRANSPECNQELTHA